MKYSSLAVANTFIDIAKKEDKLLTPMKLQKLVYFAHGWYLALEEKPLIHEQVEAWKYGPVIPTIYHEFKVYGTNGIKKQAYESQLDESFNIITTKPIVEDKETLEFLDKIWDTYGHFSGIQLSNATHEPDTPWSKTWGDGDIPQGTDINNDTIKEYFTKLAQESE